VDWSEDAQPLEGTDALTEPHALARWGRRLGLLDDAAITDDELDAAHGLRRALHLTFAAIARGEEPPLDAIETVRATHAAAVADAHVAEREGVWSLEWDPDDPRRVRFVVALDALALLGDARRLPRVRRCPGRNCGWLFLDLSGRRRWCSMTTCGSREKMRRMYERRRAESEERVRRGRG
jgi:predicted RNA-binding Zn ribbon-like protein